MTGNGFLDLEEFVGLVGVEGEEKKERELREALGMYEMELVGGGQGASPPGA